MVSLTITRRPLYVVTHVSGDLDLHHPPGRHLAARSSVSPALVDELERYGNRYVKLRAATHRPAR